MIDYYLCWNCKYPYIIRVFANGIYLNIFSPVDFSAFLIGNEEKGPKNNYKLKIKIFLKKG